MVVDSLLRSVPSARTTGPKRPARNGNRRASSRLLPPPRRWIWSSRNCMLCSNGRKDWVEFDRRDVGQRLELSDAEFAGKDLAGVFRFPRWSLHQANFYRAELLLADFRGATLAQADFVKPTSSAPSSRMPICKARDLPAPPEFWPEVRGRELAGRRATVFHEQYHELAAAQTRTARPSDCSWR